jgi:rhodanese-related sulfurtransferase
VARAILAEAVLVAAAGALLAFGANGLSPRGLSLTRNYFPGTTSGTVSIPAASVIAGIKSRGLQWLDGERMAKLAGDPRVRQQRVVFVDARDLARYQEGHIPGAYELDPYHPEAALATVLPVCLAAEQVVVYCNGGDCEDSQFAAIALRDAGVPAQKLFVFAGGIAEWGNRGLPVETGDRNSGTLLKKAK